MKWFNAKQISVIFFIGVMMLSIACGTDTAEPALTAVSVDLETTVEAKVKAILTAVPTIASTTVPASKNAKIITI